ncbi:MAG TPA: hypothetical protein VH640_22065 [Bryobacteraceae bacterium]
MATPLQIEANRRNSLMSTGPRTPEGKAASRFNALKSGIHAEAQIIPGEDPAELEALSTGYHDQFHPASPIECFLVDTLIHADWQLRRLRRLEAQLWTSQLSEIKEDASLGRAFVQSLDAFTRLQRRIDATERSYYRALRELRQLQVASGYVRAEPAPDPQPPAPDLASFRQTPAPAAEAPPPDLNPPSEPQPDMLIR